MEKADENGEKRGFHELQELGRALDLTREFFTFSIGQSPVDSRRVV